MSISAPEVTIESVIQTEFAALITAAATQIPLIFTDFPADYIADCISYITDPDFKVNTIFSYYFDPAVLPAFNIVLASENESPDNRQMYLNDAIETAEQIPNTQSYTQYGSDWACSVSIIIRAQKARQCIVLYNIIKWILLKNRMVLEAAGIKASKFSGSDLAYTPTPPTFIFNRQIKMDCRIYNTVDTLVAPPAPPSITVNHVVSAWPSEVRTMEIEDEVLGQ